MRFYYIVILLGVSLFSCKKSDPSPSSSSSSSTSNSQSPDNKYCYIKFYMNGDSSITYYDPYQVSSNGYGSVGITIPQSVVLPNVVNSFTLSIPSDSLSDTLKLKQLAGKSYPIDSSNQTGFDYGLTMSLYNAANNTFYDPVPKQSSNVYKHTIISIKYAGFDLWYSGYYYTVYGYGELLMYNTASPTQSVTVTVKYKVYVQFP